MQKTLSLWYYAIPGISLCLGITLICYALHGWGQQILEDFTPDVLVLAILIGAILRSSQLFNFDPFEKGISFSARFLLEVAVMLFGASISVTILAESGFIIISTILVLVVVSIGISYSLSRLFGLSAKLSFLIACGNAICGNSAIVAIASVIKAKSDEVASAIAFTAILGTAAVLLLPASVSLFSFNDHQYGVFAGMTVYAVPQVLAATLPVSISASHSGMVIKLIRVLMLGPLIFCISLLSKQSADGREHVRWRRLVPWFIIGFASMMLLRSLGLIPLFLLAPLEHIAKFLTILSMAALGLGVNLRSLARSGGRVMLAASASLLILGMLAAICCLFFIV